MTSNKPANKPATMTSNKPATIASKPATIASKPQGVRRVTNKKGADKAISDFVMNASIPVGARASAQKALEKALTPAIGCSVFGHMATGAMTSTIDAFLVDFAKTGNVDSKALIERAFNAYTVTSRVKGKPHVHQVDATFKKVLSHLQNFDYEHNKCIGTMYAKKVNQARYTPDNFTDFVKGFTPIARALRADFSLAYNAFKKSDNYKAWQRVARAEKAESK